MPCTQMSLPLLSAAYFFALITLCSNEFSIYFCELQEGGPVAFHPSRTAWRYPGYFQDILNILFHGAEELKQFLIYYLLPRQIFKTSGSFQSVLIYFKKTFRKPFDALQRW